MYIFKNNTDLPWLFDGLFSFNIVTHAFFFFRVADFSQNTYYYNFTR